MKIGLLVAAFIFSIHGQSQLLQVFQDPVTLKFGYKNFQSKAVVVNPKYDKAFGLYTVNSGSGEYLASVMMNNKWGFIDKNGKEIIPLTYDRAYSFSEGLAAVMLDGKWGFIDSKGIVAIPIKYDAARGFTTISSSKKLAPLKQNGKWGYINTSGEWVINPQFDDAWPVQYLKAAVKQGNKWGYVDGNGKIVIPLQYDYADRFISSDTAIVANNSIAFLINKKGEKIQTPAAKTSYARTSLEGVQAYLDGLKNKQ